MNVDVSVDVTAYAHPRLLALIDRARAPAGTSLPRVAIVYACDTLALQAAHKLQNERLAQPLLVGPRETVLRAAVEAQLDISNFEIVRTDQAPTDAALRAAKLVRDGTVCALMKGSLHTDELMSAVVHKSCGLRDHGAQGTQATRISHAFIFDLPRYHKLLALADCVVNISPDLKAKRDILGNAVALLQRLGITEPKVGIVAAIETVNAAIPATGDAQALVALAQQGQWPGAIVEGPFGFDNAISAEAARVKGMKSRVAGDADLLLMPDLNAGNMLYKSFNYIGGGDCAGIVLGATAPVVLTSRADSALSRLASVALALLATKRAAH